MLPTQTAGRTQSNSCLFTMSTYFSQKILTYRTAVEMDGYSTPGDPGKSKSPFLGLTFSESDIGPGYSYNFRSPSGRQQGSVRGKDDAEIARAFSCSSVYLQRGSDSWGGSSVCFPGVSSSSGTSDLLFLHPVCLLGDRQMRTVPCALGL